MNLTLLDWTVIALYFLFNLGIGLYYARRARGSTSEFFLSGRDVPWWLAGTSMVATTFAADTPLLVTGLGGEERHRRQLAVVEHGDERHDDRVLLRPAVAAGRRDDRHRVRRAALFRQAGRVSARLSRTCTSASRSIASSWVGSTWR